jgi:hypothetical protein
MPSPYRLSALDLQRVTARRYRNRHRGETGNRRLLAAASIEARAAQLMLREMLAT